METGPRRVAEPLAPAARGTPAALGRRGAAGDQRARGVRASAAQDDGRGGGGAEGAAEVDQPHSGADERVHGGQQVAVALEAKVWAECRGRHCRCARDFVGSASGCRHAPGISVLFC